MSAGRPTLGQIFVVALLGLALLLGLLFSQIFRASRQSIVDSSEPVRALTSQNASRNVEAYLDEAESAIQHVENQVKFGACNAQDALSVEESLFAEVLNNGDLAEVAFTHAVGRGFDDAGQMIVERGRRWQVSVFRVTADRNSSLTTRFTSEESGRFASDVRTRPMKAGLLGGPLVRQKEPPPDPTLHPTFVTPSSRPSYGQVTWSDLSYTELDAHLPETQQRVVVTVMKALEDRAGQFVGVVRVGLLERGLDEKVPAGAMPGHRVFLCDDQGRLLTRLAPGDRLQDFDGDLRVVSTSAPPEIIAALRHPSLKDVRPDRLETNGTFESANRRFLVSFRGLPHTQGWRVGVVVAEDQLPGIAQLQAARRALLRWTIAVMAAILLSGTLTLRGVRRGLARVVDQTRRMRHFDFAPSSTDAPFRDVTDVMDSVELAKTAMRAMGKYVPIDLVRLLYTTGREPVLGGELLQITVMFTDIEDFTTHAERLDPNTLAVALGRYLEAMTVAILSTGGTIDKYIGDAVMALWNAPSPCPDHPVKACRAALDCVAATDALYASPRWAGLPRFVTRFGLHTDSVMVGHFGAPERMSYTALGDGVNLASRLEGLNKQYGTRILTSEAVYETAKKSFAFRRLDRVAVKGKTRGIEVYELVGEVSVAPGRLAAVARYEEALALYFERRFDDAAQILAAAPDDAPSVVLAARCRAMSTAPPPPDWDGIYVSRMK